MNEGVNKASIRIIIKEIQTLTTISYIIAVGIGMLFNFKKYAEFGINIFDYADVLDFLIAPFADVVIIAITVITVIIVYLLFKLDSYWYKKFPRSYAKLSFGLHDKPWYDVFRYISTFFAFIIYLYLSASFYGKYKMKQIKEQPEITIKFTDNETAKGIMIGKTKDTIFLLNTGNVKAIPTGSVKEFEIK